MADHREGRRGRAHVEDMLDEVGMESFPASDPPATWSGEDRGHLPDQTDSEE